MLDLADKTSVISYTSETKLIIKDHLLILPLFPVDCSLLQAVNLA